MRRPDNWLEWVTEPQTEAELKAMRGCVARGAPYGSERWQQLAARRLSPESTLRPRGRPRRKLKK